MTFLRSIMCAFSCFSIVPMPQLEWDSANMRYMMAAFPLVGLFIGVCLYGWSLLCAWLGFGSIFSGAGLTLVPLLLSGGIHMDGFADVADALSSHASLERKREILKDPHTGAFAVIAVVCYVLAYFACATEIRSAFIPLLACIPIVSRCLSGFAVTVFKAAGADGMYAAEQGATRAKVVLVVLGLIFAATLAFMCWQHAIAALVLVCVGLICLVATKAMAETNFGGMSGDIAGFLLQVSELAMLLALVVVACIMA